MKSRFRHLLFLQKDTTQGAFPALARLVVGAALDSVVHTVVVIVACADRCGALEPGVTDRSVRPQLVCDGERSELLT